MSSSPQQELIDKYFCGKEDEYVHVLVIMGFFGTLNVILFFVSAFRFYREPKAENSILKKLALGNVVICSISPFLFIAAFEAYFNTCDFDDGMVEQAVGFLLSGLNICNVFTIFALRLSRTFEDTPYAVSTPFGVWIFVVISVIVAGFVTVVLVGVVAGYLSAAATLSSVCVLFGTINGVVLLVVFIQKLNKVITAFLREFGRVSGRTLDKLNRQLSTVVVRVDPPAGASDGKTSATTVSEEVGTPSSGGSKKYETVDDGKTVEYEGKIDTQTLKEMVAMNKIVSDMSRYTILVSFAMTSTAIVSIVVFLPVLLGGSYIYPIAFVTFDQFVNSLCLMLQFNVYKDLYVKLCSKCHLKCQERQTKQINENVEKEAMSGKMLSRVVSLKNMTSGDVALQINSSGADGTEMEAGAGGANGAGGGRKMLKEKGADDDVLKMDTKSEAVRTMRNVEQKSMKNLRV